MICFFAYNCRGGYQPPAITHALVGAGLLLRCPKFARRADDGFKFRPLPLLFARCIRHRRRSQTSPGRPAAKNHRPCGCCRGMRAADSRPYDQKTRACKGGQRVCCGARNLRAARTAASNFDRCHSFLLAVSATGGARKRPVRPYSESSFRVRRARRLCRAVLFVCEADTSVIHP